MESVSYYGHRENTSTCFLSYMTHDCHRLYRDIRWLETVRFRYFRIHLNTVIWDVRPYVLVVLIYPDHGNVGMYLLHH